MLILYAVFPNLISQQLGGHFLIFGCHRNGSDSAHPDSECSSVVGFDGSNHSLSGEGLDIIAVQLQQKITVSQAPLLG